MINGQGQMLKILLNNLLQNAIAQIKFQAQIKLPGGSSISSSNSEMIRARKYYTVSAVINNQ
jgi:hypothetical protein